MPKRWPRRKCTTKPMIVIAATTAALTAEYVCSAFSMAAPCSVPREYEASPIDGLREIATYLCSGGFECPLGYDAVSHVGKKACNQLRGRLIAGDIPQRQKKAATT